MRLLQWEKNGDFSLSKNFIQEIPPYAILSHTWGEDTEEVTFRDLTDGTGKDKVGYEKIQFCGEQARRDGLHYFWVDTCCIDKSNAVEFQEAINSMFRWYENAARCYVYLSDVWRPAMDVKGEKSHGSWEPALRKSRWFTRGWTLQELLAPASVEFFSKDNEKIGDKKSLERQISEITGIPVKALHEGALSSVSTTERISWQDSRKTTRQEDKVYSLLGICGVHMPLIYGEGEDNAFIRLREEIDKAHKGKSLSTPSCIISKHSLKCRMSIDQDRKQT
jgi:hypothetical protein